MGLWSHGISIFGRWDTRKLNLSVHVQWPGERPCGVVIRRQLSPSPEEKPHQKPNQLTLTLDFWPAELWENEFKLTVKPPSLWSWLPRLTNTAGTISVCAQSCPALCDSMDCSLPGFSVHGISQARILKCVLTSFSNVLFHRYQNSMFLKGKQVFSRQHISFI